jgi:hypothetical protein
MRRWDVSLLFCLCAVCEVRCASARLKQRCGCALPPPPPTRAHGMFLDSESVDREEWDMEAGMGW